MKKLITPKELSSISNLALDASQHRYAERYVLLYSEGQAGRIKNIYDERSHELL